LRGLFLLLLIAYGIYRLVRWFAQRESGQPPGPAWGDGGPPTPRPIPPPPARERLALAVEASLTVHKAMELVLGPEGFEVRAVETADELDRALGAARPDVILLDPDLLGAEARGRLGRRLKQDGRLQGVPVVLVGETGENLWPLEPVAQVPRPFESQELLHVVSSAALVGRANAPRGERPAPAAQAEEASVCPVCGDGIEEVPARCPACGRAHHPECLELNDGCGACGAKPSATP
jgi:CheY-like chemotaxis protein